MKLKKLLSVILCILMVAASAFPGISAGATEQTITYWAKDCTASDNSSAGFATQSFSGVGTFSRFEGTQIGDYATYVVDVETAGEYDFSIRYRAHESTAKTSDVYVNGVKLDTVLNQTGTANTAYTADMGTVSLNAGENTIKFVITSASTNGSYKLNLFTFDFTYVDAAQTTDLPIGMVGGNIGGAGTADGDNMVYTAVNCQSDDYSSASFGSQTTGDYTFSRFDATEEGAYATYIIHVETAGQYKLLIRYRAHESVGKANFYLNGVQQEKDFTSTGAANSYYQVNMGIYNLEEGDNYIQFKMYEAGSSGTYKLNIVDFTLAQPDDAELNGYTQTPGASSDKVESYAFESIYDQSANFSLKADGIDVPVVAYTDSYDYAQFSFKGAEQAITLEITYSSAITSYSISPLKYGIQGTVSGNKLTFTIDQSVYLIIRINGESKRLVITADPPQTDVPASSGEGIFNVTDPQFGADKTGKESSYAAIQSAVDAASAYGSTDGNSAGIVYIPSGVYFIGSLELKSNIKVYLEGGAILRASKNAEDFVAKGKKNSLGLPITYLIYTEMDSTNIQIYGRGTVDGDGSNVRGLGFALQTLSPNNTSYFTTDGITYRDSGMWSIVPAWSDHLNFLNIKILNTIKLGEDDGIDVVGCQDVLVQHAIAIMWDDPFSTKTYGVNSEISGGWGDGPAEINDGVAFDDCVSWTGCYGFKVGQGFSYAQQNISFTNGTVYECAVGIGIHHKQGGGACSNVTFDNIDIESICYQNDDHKTWFVAYIQAASGTGGPVSNVTVKNINVRDSSTSTPKLLGKSDEINISNVSFENITFKGNTGAATTLAQMGFTDEYSAYSENCYVVNPVNAKTPAAYYSSASLASVIADSNADTAQAVQASTGAVLYYPDVDFGELIQKFNIRYAADSDSYIKICVDDATHMVGRFGVSGGGSEVYTIGSSVLTGSGSLTGKHDVYLITMGDVKIDWFQPYADTEEANQAAAAAVDSLIESIGTVTADFSNESTLVSAENAYAQLTDVQKLLVQHEDVLTAARTDYDNLTAARSVDSLITAIGTLSTPVTEEQQTAISAARSAYGVLSDAQKLFVTKLDDLKAAEAAVLAGQVIVGDLNNDKLVTVSDVVDLRALIMAGYTADDLPVCDLDGDGTVTVADVVELRAKIMAGI